MKTAVDTMAPKRRHASGQVLLEALLAMAILAIGLVSLLSGLLQLQNRSLEAVRAERAMELISQKRADLELAGATKVPSGTGTFAPPDAGYAWTVKNEPTQDQALRQLTVTVTWQDGGGGHVALAWLVPLP